MTISCYLPIASGAEATGHYPTAEAARDAVSPTALIGFLALSPTGQFRCADPTCTPNT